MGLWSGLGMRPRSIGVKLSVEDLIDGQTNQKQGLSGWWHRCRQLLAMAFATAFAFVANSHSQQYKNCIARSDITNDQCSLLYPAQR